MINLQTVKDKLERKTGAQFTLFAWQQTPDANAWGTITADGEGSAVWGDDQQQEVTTSGSVHLFTRKLDNTPLLVEDALKELGMSYRLDYAHYEDDTRILHHEWVWEEWGRPNV